LWLDAEVMRRIGYPHDRPTRRRPRRPGRRRPLRVASPSEMRDRVDGVAPAEGQDYDAILAELEEHVLPFVAH